MTRALVLALGAALALALPGCDNVGRLFDPDKGGGPGGGGTTSGVQAMVVGGNAEDGRPRVRAVFPSGAGWPDVVPIVVVFSETMNADSIASATGAPGLFVRIAGGTTTGGGTTSAALPAAYDFLFGGTVVVIRPAAPLTNPLGSPDFEIVIQPTVADGDGVTFGGSADNVLGSFTTDEATGGSPQQSVDDGRVLVTLPQDGARDQPREIPIYAIFTKPVDAASVLPPATGFQLRVGSTAVAGETSFPLLGPLGPDRRVLRFDPDAPALAGNLQHEIAVDDSITFGGGVGVLEFERNPITTFRTIPFTVPTAVALGNPSPGFPGKVNLGNLGSLQVAVTVDGTAAAGDLVVARIYGLDPKTTATDDVNFVERQATLGAAGVQTRHVDFTGALGTPNAPRFADGELTFAVQLRRGPSRRTGYVLSSATAPPVQDTTVPDLVLVGPPGTAGGDVFVDQEFAAFFGQASEPLGAAQLSAAGTSVDLFAASAGGTFAMRPLYLALTKDPVPYQLTLTDASGNMAPGVFAGDLVPRGVVRDSVQPSGELEVEVYDESTYAAVAGATVVVQPDPASAVGRVVGTTDAVGRVLFTGLGAAAHTVTVAATGRHLVTLMDTGAGFASLPVRPMNGATASLSGSAAFQTAAGTTARIGHNLIDDVLAQDIATSLAAPTAIPATAIRPNRMQVITGFAGTFEPTGVPAYFAEGCQMCGTGATLAAPGAPAVPGGTTVQNLALLNVGSAVRNLAAPFALDFGAAAGLDTGNLSGDPTVRIVGNLLGFAGQTLFGVGLAQPTTAPSYSVNGTFSPAILLALAPYAPVVYVSTEARDQSGNVSRHRALVDASTAVAQPLFPPPGIPTIADPPPGGPFTGAPLVTYDDYLATVLPGIAFLEITATDQAGSRRWTVLRQDVDGTSLGEAVQLPDLTGTGAAGLAPGRWSVRAETHLIVSTSFPAGWLVVEELRRQQVQYARAAAVEFVVN